MGAGFFQFLCNFGQCVRRDLQVPISSFLRNTPVHTFSHQAHPDVAHPAAHSSNGLLKLGHFKRNSSSHGVAAAGAGPPRNTGEVVMQA